MLERTLNLEPSVATFLSRVAFEMSRIALLLIVTHRVVAQSCPQISNTSFQLASAFTDWQYNNQYVSLEYGLQVTDINGDSLPDMLWGWSNGAGSPTATLYNCVYLNTGCAWVPQAAYTGPDNSCLPTYALRIRGMRWSFKGLTVKKFVAEIAEHYTLEKGDIAVRVRGEPQSPTFTMEELASSNAGFDVTIGTSEVYKFTQRVAAHGTAALTSV